MVCSTRTLKIHSIYGSRVGTTTTAEAAPSPLLFLLLLLDGYNFAGIHLDAQKDSVALDEGTTVEQLVRNEAWETEAKLIRFIRWPLEVLPCGIGHKGLSHTALSATLGALLEQCEGDGVREGPLEQRIILARQHLYVHRDMRILARSVAIEEHGGLQLVAVLGGVERRRHQLESIFAACLGHFGRPIRDLPQQCARIVDR